MYINVFIYSKINSAKISKDKQWAIWKTNNKLFIFHSIIIPDMKTKTIQHGTSLF